jgi:hypothetical protein
VPGEKEREIQSLEGFVLWVAGWKPSTALVLISPLATPCSTKVAPPLHSLSTSIPFMVAFPGSPPHLLLFIYVSPFRTRNPIVPANPITLLAPRDHPTTAPSIVKPRAEGVHLTWLIYTRFLFDSAAIPQPITALVDDTRAAQTHANTNSCVTIPASLYVTAPP